MWIPRPLSQGTVIYTGDTSMIRKDIHILPWHDLDTVTDDR
jgi:hypothetical protein